MRRRLRFAFWELGLVAAGAVPGALLRWRIGVQIGPLLADGAAGVAAAHLLANVAGSFLLGVLAGPIPWRAPLLLLGGVGFCGSLTTFSSWMLDLVWLGEEGQTPAALALLVASLMLGLAAAAIGLASSRAAFRPPEPPRSPR
ncbi:MULTISPECIES: CrcB family protein [unclassified Synechococcus]|uniref:fluoride efflux transporter FluC n=1 Tax=unclassified Synechococcus TaxID=2626047 RepID=UPI0021A7C88E|nr:MULTISPECIES: CrcB family protein [unclassified Synechococcus]MCT0214599.1 CrcB family protein [Synechococcus sp. CS-1326]MCT0233933.1 CrcB family protein [Synechococcus sp. CS-1327]